LNFKKLFFVNDKSKPWGIFLAFYLSLILINLVINKLDQLVGFSSSIFFLIMSALSNIIVVAFFFFYYKKRFHDLVTLFRFSLLNFLHGIFSLLLIFLVSLVLPRLLILKDFASASDIGFNFTKFSWLSFIAFITMVIVIPITEEIFTRGVLLRLFLEYYSLPLAIIFNGVAFALGHIAPRPFLFFYIMEIFFYGVFLSSITYKTKNLSFAFGFHIANNFLALLIG